MKRLPFRIPEYAPRTTWSSTHAREVWAPRIQRVSNAWMQVERLLVAEGVRPSALQNVTPEDLPGLMKQMAGHGLVVLPLTQTARAMGYQAGTQQMQPGAAWDYRVAVTRPENGAEWAEAWSRSDNETIGRLLGYPECCRRFFDRVWVAERWMDTTWEMAQGTVDAQRLNAPGISGISVKPGINILWRWHGVRSVSHLPCSFGCRPSIELGDRALDVVSRHFPEEGEWLREILSWPVEWSALHGIAEIRTPISRTSVATDATADKLIVRYKGSGYPAEGAQGLGFPHRAAVPKPVKVLQLSDPADNGFSSREAMESAHRKLLTPLLLEGRAFGTVIDLGCGDGLLLSKVPATRRVGVEINPAVAEKARKRLDKVILGDVTNRKFIQSLLEEEKPDLVIAQNVRNPARELVGRGFSVLSYSYDTNESPRLITPNEDGLRHAA